MASRKLPTYQMIDGCRYALGFSPAMVRSGLSYEPRADDVFIVTYPKCGTTWMQQVMYLLFHGGEPPSGAKTFYTSNPFLEFTGSEEVKKLARPVLLKLHQPFHRTPYHPRAKYIYVARNPKDCCVSFYHHTKMFPEYQFQDGRFDDYFELFLKGEVDFGDYFDHLFSWYSHRNDPNVFFTTYEAMKTNFDTVLSSLAAFLGPSYEQMLRDDPTVGDKIRRYSSFDFMRDKVNSFVEEMFSGTADKILSDPDVPATMKAAAMDPVAKIGFERIEDVKFVRKGVIGEWRNHLSDDQNRTMDLWIAQRTAECPEVLDLWKDYDCL